MLLYKSLEKHLEEYEKKRDKYDQEYQMSGSASSSRTKEKYDDLVYICKAAQAAEEEEDRDRKRRFSNSQSYIGKIKEQQELFDGKMYTAEELLDHLQELQNIML